MSEGVSESLTRNLDPESVGVALNATQEAGYLSNVSEIVIKQCADVAEMARGTEEPNKYAIFDKISGEKLFHVQEDEAVCMQQTCGGNRAFKLKLYDKFKRELILIKRPNINCDLFCGLLACCDKVEVSLRNFKSLRFEWKPVGTVEQTWSPIFPNFHVSNSEGEGQFNVRGPLFTSGCFASVRFPIKGQRGRTVGEICKEWAGVCQEHTSDYDLFSLTFPSGCDENAKILLIGALLLIDFKYYESCACPCIC